MFSVLSVVNISKMVLHILKNRKNNYSAFRRSQVMHDGTAIRTGSLFHLHFNPYSIKEYNFFSWQLVCIWNGTNSRKLEVPWSTFDNNFCNRKFDRYFRGFNHDSVTCLTVCTYFCQKNVFPLGRVY